jgi:CelD/BcsL family acetyltransferase involved in cellulose biosynthesis
MTLAVTTLTTEQDLDGLERPWRDLLGRTANDLPFLLPEWGVSWWRCFRQDAALIRDSLRIKVVRDGSGEVLGILPLMQTERPGFGPVRARTLAPLGADRNVTEMRGPIVDPAQQRDVARALAADLLLDTSWDWVAWHGLDRASEFASELDRARTLQWGAGETASILPLAPTWDAFRAGLKRNIKESLRHCTNSLKRDGLTARLVVAEDRAAVDRALDTFFVLHGKRALEESGPQHPDRFAADKPRLFLRQVCERLSGKGGARVLTLLVNDQAVASRVAFVMPGCLYLYYSGYEPAWRKYSVATTLVAEAIKYAIGLGLPRLHLSMGQDVSKSRWGPETSMLHDAVWASPRSSSRAALWLYSRGRDSLAVDSTLGHMLPQRRFD